VGLNLEIWQIYDVGISDFGIILYYGSVIFVTSESNCLKLKKGKNVWVNFFYLSMIVVKREFKSYGNKL
jgi:hypothetical protein